ANPCLLFRPRAALALVVTFHSARRRAGWKTAPRMGRRAALAQDERCGCRGARYRAAAERPCDAVSRTGQGRGLLRAARPGARAGAPGAESRVRSGRHLQSGPDVPGALGSGELALLLLDGRLRLPAECAFRVPLEEPRVQLAGNRRV